MTAYGDDPRHHAIRAGAFTCTAPPDAPCRTSPTCECETWCSCDGSQEDATDTHGEGEHCCMTTTVPGKECWIVPWIEAVSLEDTYIGDPQPDDGSGAQHWPDGPVQTEWDDSVLWDYVVSPAGVSGGGPR